MAYRSWQRPSLVVVGAAALWLGVFVVTGSLPLDGVSASERGATVVRAGSGSIKTVPVAVRGRVLDALGTPLPAIEVAAASGERTTTDADGLFAFEVARAVRGDSGVVDLEFAGTGLRSKWQRVPMHAPEAALVRMAPSAPWDQKPSAPEPEVATLFGEGFVRTFDGKPGANTFVTVKGTGVWARTDAIGRYTLPLPAGDVELVAHAPEGGEAERGMAVRSERFLPGRDRGVVPLPDLVVEPGALLRGRVADQSGVPVVGAPIEVRGDGFARVIESGLSGVFRLAGLLPGRYEVRPVAYRGSIGKSQVVEIDEAGAECVLAMEAVGERRVRVLDEEGHPIPRAHVVASVGGKRCSVAQADTDGWASVRATRDGVEWEVRSSERLDALPVQRSEAEALIVAQP
ncbi:MAG: Carboxypeptidase regulatory-like domain [Planctomycetota bacterium]|jgi:hypothetical protein